MANRVLRAGKDVDGELSEGIAAIDAELHMPLEFPPEVEAAAQRAAASPRLPETDRTDIELVTIDPVGSMDLDQAMHLERDGKGYLVHYAIADLTAFITPGDAVDVEANKRAETMYGAQHVMPLHPTSLSNGAASLLPGELRPAYLWTLRLDQHGEVVEADVERAKVTSRERLDYESVQKQLDDGTASPMLQLLREVGRLRVALEIDRGGINLPMPEQDIVIEGGHWQLQYRTVLPVEDWNAQISLMTGFAAASMMLAERVGILRTLPPPPPDAIKRLHRTAKALKVDWPAEQQTADFIRGLSMDKPNEAAMIVACTSVLRGAGYVGFDGETPDQPEHAALASEYAHVTAPLRRLVDRYGLAVCAALSAGEDVPAWVTAKLHDLPAAMQNGDRLARQYERAVVDLAEALELKDRVGETFTGVVLEVAHDDPGKGEVMVRDPDVEADLSGTDLPVGEEVQVRLTEADPTTRKVHFEVV